MHKKLFKTISILSIFTLVAQTTGVYAFMGEDVGIDFYKSIDKGSIKNQQKMIENEIEGSAKKIDDYIVLNNIEGGNENYSSYLDTGKDFTRGELDGIRDDGNVAQVFSHLSQRLSAGEDKLSIERLFEIRNLIVKWYNLKEGEMKTKEKSMSAISVSGLYTDGNKENSGYDIIDDLKKINGVIFSDEIQYGGTENETSLEFGDILAGLQNNISSAFRDDSSPLNNTIPIAGGGTSLGAGSTTTTTTTNSTSTTTTSTLTPEEKLAEIKPKSTLCSTGTEAGALGDKGLLSDLESQLKNGESSTTTTGGKGNSNGESSGNGTVKHTGNGPKPATSGGGSQGGTSGGLFDSFPCSSIFCIEISMTMYKQKLLGGKTSSIEGVLDKHLKIIDQYAGKSMIQSNMTKNFFSLSILKNMNLPSMVYLGMVISHVPPPILNLKKKSGKESSEFANETILERTFEQNGLDYKTQNEFSPDYEYKTIGNCVGMEVEKCQGKLVEQQNLFTPFISNSDIMMTKIGESYKGSVNDDIAELIGFSNTFKTNIEQITDVIVAMSKNKE